LSAFKDRRDLLRQVALELQEKIRPRTKDISIREFGKIETKQFWRCNQPDQETSGVVCPKEYLAAHYLHKHLMNHHRMSYSEAHNVVWKFRLTAPSSVPVTTIDVDFDEQVESTSSQSVPIIEMINSMNEEQKKAKPTDFKSTLFLTYDCETTGFRRDEDAIIQIAAFDMHSEDQQFNSYISNKNHLGVVVPNSPGAFVVNQITPDTMKAAPSFKDTINKLVKWVNDFQATQVIFMCHNRSFDYEFLFNGCRNWGINLPENWGFVCSQTLGNDVIL
jgi:hypothetical protein